MDVSPIYLFKTLIPSQLFAIESSHFFYAAHITVERFAAESTFRLIVFL